jgi:hypothetical protein
MTRNTVSEHTHTLMEDLTEVNGHTANSMAKVFSLHLREPREKVFGKRERG